MVNNTDLNSCKAIIKDYNVRLFEENKVNRDQYIFLIIFRFNILVCFTCQFISPGILEDFSPI